MTCPHCLGASCLHCREYAAQRTRRRRHSLLTPKERRELGLMPLQPLRFLPPAIPPTPRRFGTPVLPDRFRLRTP